ncbi:hypothetical protein M441DRAFT_51034 [Trichoderma asperellum CBS 433.97]|uniref:Uncharacterized protein n=1 Tax=Trichoderma asperellum (strain ATCC 204424 / CBS 433.97 / NBRC 101777) TaxID=1042311 RepID=A0A2T3YWX7_TRIA4|nr:hypothetical protein M441DRAFT_51034 [Trichoderma asperellum CBS 433.97]PTB37037.1 hypothetical protein M441DRAFT_51034 [Trichoderma asperellum CBS 433.97]
MMPATMRRGLAGKEKKKKKKNKGVQSQSQFHLADHSHSRTGIALPSPIPGTCNIESRSSFEMPLPVPLDLFGLQISVLQPPRSYQLQPAGRCRLVTCARYGMGDFATASCMSQRPSPDRSPLFCQRPQRLTGRSHAPLVLVRASDQLICPPREARQPLMEPLRCVSPLAGRRLP